MDYEALSQIALDATVCIDRASSGLLASVEHAARLATAADAACRAALHDEPALAGCRLVPDDVEWHCAAPVRLTGRLHASGHVSGLQDGRAGCRMDLRVALSAGGIPVAELTLRYALVPPAPRPRSAASQGSSASSRSSSCATSPGPSST